MTRVQRITQFPFLLFLVAALLALTGCDTTVNDQGPQPFDGTGTISGQLVDKTTNDPLAGAAVTLKSTQEDDDSTPRTDTTGSDGQFYFENVPVNRASDSGTPSSQHVLDLDLSGVSGPYRNRYSAEVSLPYGGSEDGGSANNLTASVTIPVSRLNANIQGRVNDTEGSPLSGADVVLVQRLPLSFNAGGDPSDFTDVQVDTATTGDDGTYAFNGAEASTDAFLLVTMNGTQIGRDPNSDYFRIPASSGSSVGVDRGETGITPPPFTVSLSDPERGADLGEDNASFVFHFNTPVADLPFTSTDTPFSNGSMRDFFRIERTGAKRRASGDLEIDLSFNDDRTELTVSTVDPLQDGSEYEFDADAFEESEFKSVYGQSLANGSEFSDGNAIDFSVGINESTPAQPTFSFTTDDGNQPTDNGTPFDYGDDFSARFELPATDPNVELKEYEVFVKSGDGDFEPVDTAPLDGFTPDGSDQVEFRITFANSGSDVVNNFVGPEGGYNEKQVRVRAVSINNVRSDPSNTLTIADQNRLNIQSSVINDTDNDGEDELVATFNEPVDPSTISTGAFTILRNSSPLSGVIESVDSQYFDGEEVVLELSDSYTPNDGVSNDELRANTGGVTDLAGNGIDDDSNANVVNIP